MLPETLERRFNGPVPRTLALGAVVDEAVLCRRQAAARVRTLMRMAARAPAGITCLRRFAPPATPALARAVARLAWARAEAETWRRRVL